MGPVSQASLMTILDGCLLVQARQSHLKNPQTPVDIRQAREISLSKSRQLTFGMVGKFSSLNKTPFGTYIYI